MNKCRSSRSHRHQIDHAISSDCSQQSQLIGNDQSEDYQRNNHNSGLIQHDDLIKSTSDIDLRKRRTTIPRNHRSEPLSSPTLLLVIRLTILLLLSLIIYYVFISIYPKPKQNGWERVWYTITDWLMRE